MIAAHGLRLVLTVLFTAVTVLSLVRAIRPGVFRAASERITHGLHAVMGLAMGVMVWPWGMDLPAAPQAAFFALAAAWFVGMALLRSRGLRSRSPAVVGHAATHGLLHAVMMGAMAWMLLAMPDSMSSVPSANGGSDSAADMPGMAMSNSGGRMSMQLHGYSRSVAVALVIVFVTMGLWWLSRALDTARLTPTLSELAGPGAHPSESVALAGAVDAGCHGAMALGMAVMLLAMV